VADARVGGDHDTGAGHLGPPREIEILGHRHDAGVEATELFEEVRAHQREAAGSHEHVTHGVVLAVVHLALGHAFDDRTGLVGVAATWRSTRGSSQRTILGETTAAFER